MLGSILERPEKCRVTALVTCTWQDHRSTPQPLKGRPTHSCPWGHHSAGASGLHAELGADTVEETRRRAKDKRALPSI